MSDKPLPQVLQGAKQIKIDPFGIGMKIIMGAMVLLMWFPFTGFVLLDTKEKSRGLFLSFFVPGCVLVLGLARDLIGAHDAWVWWLVGYVLLGAGLLVTLRFMKV